MRIITLAHSYEAIINHDNTDIEVEEDCHPFPREVHPFPREVIDYNEKVGCAIDISANPNIILFQRYDVIKCPIFI